MMQTAPQQVSTSNFLQICFFLYLIKCIYLFIVFFLVLGDTPRRRVATEEQVKFPLQHG